MLEPPQSALTERPFPEDAMAVENVIIIVLYARIIHASPSHPHQTRIAPRLNTVGERS